MTLLICYTNYYGTHVFFLPGAHIMLKPALLVGIKGRSDAVYVICKSDKAYVYIYYTLIKITQ